MKITYSDEAEQTTRAVPVAVADFLAGLNVTLARQSARIEGEVTSVKDSYATAIYFTIKDIKKDALLNCVIWRTTYNQNGVIIKVGDTIIVSGTPEIYAARGTFSLKVQTIEYAGEGQLKCAYDELKAKLTAEGLLERSRKRPLPLYATRIGVITSRSGVVIQDFSANLGRHGFNVTLIDSRVEGKDAIHELLKAIETLTTANIEILVIMRGGGSWESLQAFNTESVVRAVAAFPVPCLTGIGHDVDMTLVELVADVGSSTPTAVAEKLNESWDTALGTTLNAEARIFTSYQRQLVRLSRTLELAGARTAQLFERSINANKSLVRTYGDHLQTIFRQLRHRVERANTLMVGVIGVMRAELRAKVSYLGQLPPYFKRNLFGRVTTTRHQVRTLSENITKREQIILTTTYQRLGTLEQVIRVSDPAHNLRLGYSLTRHQGKILRSVRDLAVGESITTTVTDGSFTSTITTIQ